MAIDFGKYLPPETRARIDATNREITRLYGLPDRWLGEALLKLARGTRAEFPDLQDPYNESYDVNFVWQVVPEIAKRLGATNLLPQEGIHTRVAGYSHRDLRDHASEYLKNITLELRGLSVRGEKPTSAEILAHNVWNGNPVAIALDRLCPAYERGHHGVDWVARQIREVSRARGLEETAHWSPAMQEYGDRRAAADTDPEGPNEPDEDLPSGPKF